MSHTCSDTCARTARRVKDYFVTQHILACLQSSCGYTRTAAAHNRRLPMDKVVPLIPTLTATTCARLLDHPGLSEAVYQAIYDIWHDEPFHHDVHRGLAWHRFCSHAQQTALRDRFCLRVAIDDRTTDSEAAR